MSQESLMQMLQEGDVEGAKALIDASPDIARATNEQGVSMVMLARYMQQPEIAALLGAAKGELDVYEAIALGDTRRLGELLDAEEALLEAESPDGFRPLHYAAFFGQEAATAAILSRRPLVAEPANNPTRVHPLHSAAAARSVPICRALLDAGAEVDARQQAGFTALMAAAMHGHEELAQLLLERGADATLASDDGKTAADFAREGGHEALLDRL